jgi:hypothetical protein
MKPEGYNPLRWNCETQGCYHIKCRPKLEEFAGCFPDRIAMGDIDGVVEIKGRFLFLEWKSRPGPIPKGQRIMLEQLTRASRKITAIVVCGNPQTMTVENVSVVKRGTIGAAEPCDLDRLKDRVSRWATYARKGTDA